MQTTVIFKTDKKLKEAAQKTARAMGIPLSAVLNQGLKDLVANRLLIVSDRDTLSLVRKTKTDQ